METIQLQDEAVDVSDWLRDEEFAEYPEGAREKTLLYCPSPAPFNFLRPRHRYLFKLSSPRYQEQFWVEIIAYQLGIHGQKYLYLMLLLGILIVIKIIGVLFKIL